MNQPIDFSNAIILSPREPDAATATAVRVMAEEVQRRTGIQLEQGHEWPDDNRPVVAVLIRAESAPLLSALAGDNSLHALREMENCGADGYRVLVAGGKQPVAIIDGADRRGVLYGIGKLLRKTTMKSGSIVLPPDLSISSTPEYSVRGHQLAYRPKTNAYDAWTLAQFDQYIRELALFGVNSIEIFPPRTDDDATGPLLKVPPMEMMADLSATIDSYGLDVWIWYPNMGHDYTDPDCLDAEIAERDEVFSRLSRIHHVFIPGGDPGDVEPDVLFPWCEKVSQILRRHHPGAKLWLSPQAFRPTRAWIDSFYQQVSREPDWLGGVVFAPWTKTSLPEMRERVPARYPIRNFPDITHSIGCQFPVHEWDVAFALTHGREGYNPRPIAMKHIHDEQANHTVGSLCYSEGINDDVNKFVWSDQDWNSDTPVFETLRDYGRLFIDPDHADSIAQGIVALERNWRGPLLGNEEVETTLRQWQALEEEVSESARDCYRFQMCLMRAHYDAYIRRRLINETALEKKAVEILEQASSIGSVSAIGAAKAELGRARSQPVAGSLKSRCETLADDLFASIGSQTSVKKYKAISWDRGAFLDGIDVPLNSAVWMGAQLDRIEKLPDEADRLSALGEIVNRNNPGPGGFYHNLGTRRSWEIVERAPSQTWALDPGYLASPFVDFAMRDIRHFYLQPDQSADNPKVHPTWVSGVNTLYDTPLTFVYRDLDPASAYMLRIVYFNSQWHPHIRLVANETHVVHDYLDVNDQLRAAAPPGGATSSGTGSLSRAQEFPIPPEVTRGGELKLTWTTRDADQGPGVSEIWLIKQEGDAP